MTFGDSQQDTARRIVAIGLLTDDDLRRLGPQFDRAFPVDETPVFAELLRAIDVAEHEYRIRQGTAEADAGDPRLTIHAKH